MSVPEKLEPVAVEHVAARLGDHVDDPAVIVAVLRIKVIRQETEFLDRIKVWHDRGAAVHALLDVAPIHVESVRRFALAADRDNTWIELTRRRHGTGHTGHDDAV